MEIIKTKLENYSLEHDKLISSNSCFLDIETTGLNRNRDLIYLIGILYFDNNEQTWILNQIFANSEDEEKELLLETINFIKDFNRIINYNGNAFDIPFINQRLKIHSIDTYICKEDSLDIYSIIRSNKDILDLNNLRLKTIEEYLGIFREDMYSGKDCINFYKDYILNKDEGLKNKILKHNYDDLYYLIEVFKILDIIKDKKTFMIKYFNEDLEFYIDKISRVKDYLVITGKVHGSDILKTIYYKDNYTVSIGDDNYFEISLEIQTGLITPTETCLFIDKDDYNLPRDFMGISNYSIPENIMVIYVEKKYIIENIVAILNILLNNIFN